MMFDYLRIKHACFDLLFDLYLGVLKIIHVREVAGIRGLNIVKKILMGDKGRGDKGGG